MNRGFLLGTIILLTFFPLKASQNWEFNLHLSYWTINVIKPLIEEKIGEVLEDNLKEKIFEDLRDDSPFIYERGYQQRVEFDSRGSNFGLEVRWHPGGRNSWFSVGLAVEKSQMKISFPVIAMSMDLGFENSERNAVFDGRVENAYVQIKPLSLHFNFRFEFFPKGLIHPYITIGAGFFGISYLEKGKVNLSYNGILRIEGGEQKTYSEKIDKTIVELFEDSEDEIELPPILPIVQFNVGVKTKLSEIMDLFADFGLFNGFLFRGGLAFRF